MEKECPICKEDLEKNDKYIKTICEHLFHEKCLNDWLILNNTCPCCRNPEPIKTKISINIDKSKQTWYEYSSQRHIITPRVYYNTLLPTEFTPGFYAIIEQNIYQTNFQSDFQTNISLITGFGYIPPSN